MLYCGRGSFHTICRPKISPPKVIYKVQSMPYKSLPLGAFWTIFGRNFPTGVLQLLYPYQPANPLVESIFKALTFLKFLKFSRYLWATDRRHPLDISRKYLVPAEVLVPLNSELIGFWSWF